METSSSDKLSSLLRPFKSYKENEVLQIQPQALNAKSKLGWKGLPVTNALAYLYAMKNMKCCE
jgi:hypothetical protein